MENNIEFSKEDFVVNKTSNTSKSKIAGKTILMFSIPVVLCLAMVAAAVVWSFTIPVTATVDEAFSSTTVNLDLSGIVGNVVDKNISISNAANVPITINLAWAETANPNNVNYTITIPATFNAQPGVNIIPVSFLYDAYSPTGTVSGNVTLTRGA